MKNRKHVYWFSISILLLLLVGCSSQPKSIRPQIDLSGTWKVQLSPDESLLSQPWKLATEETVQLPGSLDENGKGEPVKESTDLTLTRIVKYEGPAIFQKEVFIPQTWKGHLIDLKMERTKVTQVWVDSVYVGSQNRIFSPQSFDMTYVMTPGNHLLTIIVDNTLKLVPVEGSHAYSEDTQTNWNGILGDFYLEATALTHIQSVKVTSDLESKAIDVDVQIDQPTTENQKMDIRLFAKSWNSGKIHVVPEMLFPVNLASNDTVVTIHYPMGDAVQLWSEFDPALYKLEVLLFVNEQPVDNVLTDFGMREFKNVGTQLEINGTTTFLRGKHEAAVFPLTGYPPMDIEGWMHVYKIAQSYGINHYRFHSWAPPEAAFEAADICGIYLQPETPIWWSFKPEDPAQMQFMIDEGKAVMDAYGNHPSFVMFALGNEIYQDRVYLKQMIDTFRAYDNRHLYAQGSNNRGSNPSQAEGDDFWVTFRTDVEKDDLSSDVRGSISFVDAVDGGQINTFYPSTRQTYSKAIAPSSIPVVGHEIGQFQVYPDYETELPKYTGVLRPGNLELFKKRLEDAGMGDQVKAFHEASGALSMLCYREDIERAIRTPGFGGFQLLDLQDYPGQGTALVGILDAFMETKGLITPIQFRDFCDAVVIQALMDKYCWTNDETFAADIQIANYSQNALSNMAVDWSVQVGGEAMALDSGTLSAKAVPDGGLTGVGQITLDLGAVEKASRATLKLKSDDLSIDYPIWIYPANLEVQVPDDVMVADALTEDVMNHLKSGGKALLFPDFEAMQDKSVGGQFIAEFWNYGMFTMLAEQWGRRKSHGTMGILTDPAHPIFNDFPTENHTNWQWWIMTKNSRPLILDETDAAYRPVVQVIDNINRNHKLGLVLEGTLREGKVLVSMINLPAIQDYPEARQLYASLLNYMASDDFNPKEALPADLF